MSPTQEDSDKYVQGAIDELDRDKGKGKFAENVSNVAEWAVQVDESFAKVTYGLKALNNQHGVDFPPLGTYLNEWKGYNAVGCIRALSILITLTLPCSDGLNTFFSLEM